MKYKIGDKVRVIKATSGCMGAEDSIGVVTDKKSTDGLLGCRNGFNIELKNGRIWRIGFESVCELVEDELTAEEAIRIQAEMCSVPCRKCPISKERGAYECRTFRAEHPDKVLEILKQRKKEHEKKPIETERAIMVRVLVGNDCNGKCVHEEEVPSGESWDQAQARVLKEYCENHEGKYISTICGICRVKEQS